MKNAKKAICDFLFIALGSFILAFAINYFLVPMKLSTGGVSGVGTVLYYTMNIPLSVTTLVINVLLFALGYKLMRGTDVLKTGIGIVLLSLFLEVTARWGGYSEDMLIATVFGGILAGVGIGITVMRGASTGGSDFAALMLNKLFPHISVANFILAIDAVIIVLSGIVFENYTVMFYSAISLYISSKVTDFLMVRGDWAKCVYIISKNHHTEIAKCVLTELDRGVTGIYSKGFYNDEDNTMLMCVVKSHEIPSLLSKVKKIDKSAFTIICDAREVHGEGFKEVN